MSYKHNKKWRLAHPKERNEERKKYYTQFRKHGRKLRRWSVEDSDLIIMSELPDRLLHKLLDRSVQAIQVKRCKLMKTL